MLKMEFSDNQLSAEKAKKSVNTQKVGIRKLNVDKSNLRILVM